MDLKILRSKIDALDSRIVGLVNERAKISVEVGRSKLAAQKAIYAPEREREVFDRVKSLNKGPMTDSGFEAVYREIMSSSLSLEKPLRIAYLGSEGSNSHIAARRKFGSQVVYVGVSSIPEVFQRVEANDCDYGVVPIENSVEGAVTHTADMLVDSDLLICAQLMHRITHTLLAKCPLAKIRKVYSNPQVLAQCRNWLLANLHPSRVQQISVGATTDAARLAAKEQYAGAITSPECAAIYKVPALKENIQDIAHNMTRFFVIGRQDVHATGRDRTSLVFAIKDRVGALHAMLAPFAKEKINLTKIESRPMKKKAWEYYFFVDLEGHKDDTKVRKALSKLEGMCKFLKILGSYPE
ncbi:MAG: prephenate dehydratase [Candidatus Omnitrophica bacterium]|nr:prephenate dehydratase [Candidatus Omnitrophota bacterium]